MRAIIKDDMEVVVVVYVSWYAGAVTVVVVVV